MNRKTGRLLLYLTALAAPVVATTLAHAQVGDPLGLVGIDPSGQGASGSVLSVSNGGTASNACPGGQPVCAGAAVSTTGQASGSLVGASGTGSAQGGSVAVSGTGTPSSGTLAADGNGELSVQGQQITVYTGAALAPTRPQDPAYIAANSLTPDELAAKEAAVAPYEQAAAYYLGQRVGTVGQVANQALSALPPTGMTGSVNCPPTVCAASMPVPDTGACPPQPPCPAYVKVLQGTGYGGWGTETWQQSKNWCAPASTWEVLTNLYGETDTQAQVASLENSDSGTYYTSVPTTMNDLFKSHGSGRRNWYEADNVKGDPNSLMGHLMFDIDVGPYGNGVGSGVIFDVKPDTLPWWRGYSSLYGHYFDGRGYDTSGGGWVYIFDVFNYGAVYRNDSTGTVQPGPYGDHVATLAQLMDAMPKPSPPYGIMIW